MSTLDAIILGIIQGISEFLPISSSGHLVLAQHFLGNLHESVVFDVGLHMATLLAIVIAMRSDLTETTKFFFKNIRSSLGLKLLTATIPVGLAGIFFQDFIVDTTRIVPVVAISLILWGSVLIAADMYSSRKEIKDFDPKKATWLQIGIMGLAQVLSLIPGTSRSGITMTAGLFTGMSRKMAAKVSFLLAIPAIAGAGLVGLKDVVYFGLDVSILSLLVGMFFSFISGALCIRGLLRLLQKTGFIGFGIYRIGLGIILIIFFL